jgi:uncharacterized membrane protein YdbT with pleckstrin-like domain
MTFETIALEQDEVVLTVVRRHWLTLFMKIFSLGIFALLPPGAWILILITQNYAPTVPVDFTQFNAQFVFIYLTWLLFMWMSLASVLLNHYLDVWVVTTRRIITVDQRGFFRRQSGSFRLEKLQDINVEIHGLIATLFDYGTIEAETASGSDGEFRVHQLPHPRELKALILHAADSLTR